MSQKAISKEKFLMLKGLEAMTKPHLEALNSIEKTAGYILESDNEIESDNIVEFTMNEITTEELLARMGRKVEGSETEVVTGFDALRTMEDELRGEG